LGGSLGAWICPCVRAGAHGGTREWEYLNFQSTQELHIKKHKKVTNGPFDDKWEGSVYEEHGRMVKNQVWRDIPNKDVSKHSKIISSTWVMKKFYNLFYRARLNTRGYEQVDGQWYD
jgi:hypothetical protein